MSDGHFAAVWINGADRTPKKMNSINPKKKWGVLLLKAVSKKFKHLQYFSQTTSLHKENENSHTLF